MIDSQVEILKSDTVALAVIKDLRLVDDPEFVGSGGGLVGNVLGLFLDILPASAPSDYQRQRKVLDRFERKLKVKRLGLSYVIEVSYESLSPERAAQIANAVAEAYIVDSLESKYQASRRASVWLQDRLKELRAQASTAERAVVDFKAKNNIVDAGGRLLTEQQLAETNSSATVARAQRAEAEARLNRITSILEGDAKAGPNSGNSPLIEGLATVTDTLNNPVIIKLRQQYLDIAGRESDWANRFGQNHLAVTNLRNQMREIRRSIADELRRTAESYKSDLEIAKRSRGVGAKEPDRHDRAVERHQPGPDHSARARKQCAKHPRPGRQLPAALYGLGPAAVVSDHRGPRHHARGHAAAAVISQDQPDPAWRDRRGRDCLRGWSGFSARRDGSGLPLGAPGRDAAGAWVPGDHPDRHRRGCCSRKWQPRRSQAATSLEIVRPQAGKGARRKSGQRTPALLQPSSNQTPWPMPQGSAGSCCPGDVASTVMSSPFSRFAELVRAIKIAADLSHLETVTKVLGITSSLPNEGKSTISKALALASAQGGARILLVDGDIRNPSLTRRLTPDAKRGLVDVILGQAAFKDVVWTEPRANLHFLPCVTATQFSNSADLLASSQMEKLFRELRDQYDRIILDLSPLAPVIDVRGTGRLVDSYVVVIEWARTRTDVVERALTDAPEIRQKLLGAVLNKVDMAVMNRYDLYRGNYYYNRYYQRYGYVD